MERRQRLQADLGARLESARQGVEAARRAQREGSAPRPEEMQVIQRRYPPLKPGARAPFPNCAQRIDPATGAGVLVCPAQVPGLPFWDRLRRLEEEVVEAEKALVEAERDYRQGVD